jgi:putative PIN family toxin of toxin-antitoxin system
MRVVADTNTLVSAYLWMGKPAEVIELHACGWIELCTCAEQLTELAHVLARPKFQQRIAAAGLSPAVLVAHYKQLATSVTPATVSAPTLADPDDLWVLGCAVAARAQAIVSGDGHLLSLRRFQGIPVYPAREFVAFYDWAKGH